MIIKIIIQTVINEVVAYLKMTPEEQKEMKKLYKEKKKKMNFAKLLKENWKKLVGITAILMVAITISEPMAKLVSSIFSKANIVFEAFYDFAPKVFALSFMTTVPSIVLMSLVWVYGMNDKRPEVRKPVFFFANITVGAFGIALVSAVLCVFSTGSLMPLVDQLVTLFTPRVFVLQVSAIAACMMASAVSVVEIGNQTKCAYETVKGWWRGRKNK